MADDDEDVVVGAYMSPSSASAASSIRSPHVDSLTVLRSDGDVVQEEPPAVLGARAAAFAASFQPRKQQQEQRRWRLDAAAADVDADPDELREPLDHKPFDDERVIESTDDTYGWRAPPPHVTALATAKHGGLLLSLAFASMLTSALKRGVLPLMQAEMAMTPSQVDATKILLMLPWSCALLVGFVSDVLPLCGSRRKAHMMLAWALTALALFLMVLLNNSFNVDGKLQSDSSLEEGERRTIVGGYIALLGFACFGGISSVVVAEVYVVALSQREVLKKRGTVVAVFLLTQFFFEGVGQTVTDMVVFHYTPAGKMSPFYSLQDALTFLVCYAIVPIPVLFFFFNDSLESTGGRLGECELFEDDDDDDDDDDVHGYNADLRLQDAEKGRAGVSRVKRWGSVVMKHWFRLWTTLQQKATWNVVCFLCVFIFFTEFTLRYPFTVLDKWANMTAKTTSTSKIFGEAMYFLSALVWRFLCLNRNWNNFVVVSYLGLYIFPPMAYYLASAFVGVGSVELYMIMGSSNGFVRGVAIIMEVAMAVEIAPSGAEGVVLGAIVSIASIIRLVSDTFSNSIGWLFGTQFLSQTTGTTTKDEPLLVATAIILCYTIRLLALVGVLFLPSQKIALLRLRFMGGRKPRRAWWTLVILALSMLTASIVNSLVITPNTTCLPAFGGKGCK